MSFVQYTPLLSVIVPVYNVEDYLDECVNSILNQTYQNLEIILVNDGSTDNSSQVMMDLSVTDHRIRVFEKANGGLSDTRNYGIEKSVGEFISFIDSDDVLLNTDIFEKIILEFKNDPQLDIVQYDVLFKWKSIYEHKRIYPFKKYVNKKDITKGFLENKIHVSSCDKVFRKNIFSDIRYPLNQQSEDIAILNQIIEKTRSLKTLDIGYYGYRHREGSITTSSPEIAKIGQILTSYSHLINFGYYDCGLKNESLNLYTKIYWDYLSLLKTFSSEDVNTCLEKDIFLSISLIDWFKYYSKTSYNNKIKCFILVVFGHKLTYNLHKFKSMIPKMNIL